MKSEEVNHPHLIGVGMSREGYGQQVDKEAYKNMENGTITMSDYGEREENET